MSATKNQAQSTKEKLSELKAFFEEHAIRRVKLGGFDIDGVLRGKYVSLEKFFSAVEKGMGYCDVIFGWDNQDKLYDNARFTGWHTGYPDLEAKVDLDTLRIIPWEEGVAACLMDFDPKVCPRRTLGRVVDQIAKQGYQTKVGIEFEFFIFDEDAQGLHEDNFADPRPFTPGMFGYSWLRSGQNSELVHEILDGLAAFDIPVEGFHTETGPGVYEAAIGADDALAAADKAALFKTVVKEICSAHGLIPSFMAKWSTKYPGCSGHIHQSLWREGKNAFVSSGKASAASKNRLKGMSPLMQSFLAGQLALMPEACAFYAPTVNSYKRLVPGTWAPTHVSWGMENRTCAARVITGPGASAMRVEMRLPGADINPYLAVAASLATGMHGVQEKLKLGPPVLGSAYDAKEAAPLPRTLDEATTLLARSKRMSKLLGKDFVEHFVGTRRFEWQESIQAVTDWELKRYFELA